MSRSVEPHTAVRRWPASAVAAVSVMATMLVLAAVLFPLIASRTRPVGLQSFSTGNAAIAASTDPAATSAPATVGSDTATATPPSPEPPASKAPEPAAPPTPQPGGAGEPLDGSLYLMLSQFSGTATFPNFADPTQPPTTEPVNIPALCSVGAYSPDGDLIAANHCTNADALAQELLGQTPYGPSDPPSPYMPKLSLKLDSVEIKQPRGMAGRCLDDWTPVRVLNGINPDNGDLVHLKWDQGGNPECAIKPLKVATQQPKKGEHVRALGFPGNVLMISATRAAFDKAIQGEKVDVKTLVDSAQLDVVQTGGQVSGVVTTGTGTSWILTDTANANGMSGGILVNDNNEVVGLDSMSTGEGFSEYTSTGGLNQFIRAEGIDNSKATATAPAPASTSTAISPTANTTDPYLSQLQANTDASNRLASEIASDRHDRKVLIGIGLLVLLLAGAGFLLYQYLQRRRTANSVTPEGATGTRTDAEEQRSEVPAESRRPMVYAGSSATAAGDRPDANVTTDVRGERYLHYPSADDRVD